MRSSISQVCAWSFAKKHLQSVFTLLFFTSVLSVTSVLKLFRTAPDWKHLAVRAKLDPVQP